MQLAEMDRSPENMAVSASTSSTTNDSATSNGDISGTASRKSTDSLATAASNAEEDDKERTIAKAALSIAELGE